MKNVIYHQRTRKSTPPLVFQPNLLKFWQNSLYSSCFLHPVTSPNATEQYSVNSCFFIFIYQIFWSISSTCSCPLLPGRSIGKFSICGNVFPIFAGRFTIEANFLLVLAELVSDRREYFLQRGLIADSQSGLQVLPRAFPRKSKANAIASRNFALKNREYLLCLL